MKYKLYTLRGTQMSLPMWCSYMKINYDTVVHRMRRGMNLEEALTKPVKVTGKSVQVPYNGVYYTMTELSHELKIGLGNLRIKFSAETNVDIIKAEWCNTSTYQEYETIFKMVTL